jgi:hypothetical protein
MFRPFGARILLGGGGSQGCAALALGYLITSRWGGRRRYFPMSVHNRLCRSNPTGKSAGGANAGVDPPFSTILVPAATGIAADRGVQCDSWLGGLLNRRKHERNCATDDAPFSTILVPAATGIAADPWASNSYQHQHEAIYFPMGAPWLLVGIPGAARGYALTPG